MGLYDRDYTRQENDSRSSYAPQMNFGLPFLTPAIKGLLIANIAVYLLNIITSAPNQPGLTLLETLFAVRPDSPLLTIQLWRLITYQFLHGGFGHIFFNMLWLLFLGPQLERQWGSRKFLIFYLFCGAAGGLFYIILVYAGVLAAGSLIGASGAILGVLTACAILLPHTRVIIFPFPFAMPIRVFAMISIFITVLNLFSGKNAGGEACHLAGVAAGGLYVFTDSWRKGLKLRFKASRWEKHIESERRLRIEVDRILKKVHDSGLHSLTYSEKNILKKATKLEQSRSRP
jgi:membrane associated rhomboid family serine protease